MLIEKLSLLGQADATGGTLEQVDGQSFLQVMDGLADRRLGYVQGIRSPAYAAGFCNRKEYTVVVKIIDHPETSCHQTTHKLKLWIISKLYIFIIQIIVLESSVKL